MNSRMVPRVVCVALVMLLVVPGAANASSLVAGAPAISRRQGLSLAVVAEAVGIDETIMGPSRLSPQQLANFLLANNPAPKIGVSALDLASLFVSEGNIEGVRGDIAFMQSIKETGYFRYGGLVLPEQNNFAGIGATNNSDVGKGAWFDTPHAGVRAQIHHLKTYGSPASVPFANPNTSPRAQWVTRGIAPRWVDLNGRWAVPGPTYGQEILALYVKAGGAPGSGSAGMSRAEAENILHALYWDILGRTVDTSGLQTWGDELVFGRPQDALVGGLTGSREYVEMRVKEAYRTVLRREAEPAGLAWWVSEVLGGRVPVDDVARVFYISQEFYNQTGGNDRAFIERMYNVALGRTSPPAAWEIEYWSGLVPKFGRESVLNGIWWSVEASENRSRYYYENWLHRAGDHEGVQIWGAVLRSQGEGAVRRGIAGSVEYRLHANNRIHPH